MKLAKAKTSFVDLKENNLLCNNEMYCVIYYLC